MNMKNKIAGYMVRLDNLRPLAQDKNGVLFVYAIRVDIFTDKKSAQEAIARTVAYGNSRGAGWKKSHYRIVTVYHAPVE